MTDAGLLARFAASFQKGNRPNSYRREATALDSLYAGLPDGFGRLPQLYEQFLLSYKWCMREMAESDVKLGYGWQHELMFLDNPDGETLAGHRASAERDRGLWETLIPNGYFPFARGGRGSYDPVCFALRERRDGDCPIDRIDHEEILCNNWIRIKVRIAPSFRDLAERACSYARVT